MTQTRVHATRAVGSQTGRVLIPRNIKQSLEIGLGGVDAMDAFNHTENNLVQQSYLAPNANSAGV